MGTVTERDTTQRQDQRLTTADLAAAATPREPQDMPEQREVREAAARGPDGNGMSQADGDARRGDEELAALFTPEVAGDFRSRWDAVQIAFVDDPGKAVRDADELVAQVMKSLAESFANERQRFESGMGEAGQATTEHQRVALRRYRSFFQRLLAL
jgi:hypothetical protein